MTPSPLGKEAAAQVETEYTVVRDAELVNYLRRVGAKLAATPEADRQLTKRTPSPETLRRAPEKARERALGKMAGTPGSL